MDGKRRSKDYFWREDYFRSLTDVAKKAKGVPGWTEYGDFCLAYERGLRARAFAILAGFLDRLERAAFDDRRRFTSWLLAQAVDAPGRHMLIPYPMQRRLIEPTLLEWTLADPGNSEPHRWLGSREDLERAIELDPADQIAIRRLLRIILGSIDYAAHERPQGYLGDPTLDLGALERANALAGNLADPIERAGFLADSAELRSIILEYLGR